MNQSKQISMDNIKDFDQYYKNNTLSQVATKAVSKIDLKDACYNIPAAAKMNHKFSIEVQTLPVTNQKSSGRCWIFSGLNILREKIAKKLNLENFELSQNYISFYDHLEKSNSFLELMIECADKPLNDAALAEYLRYPLGDGGWWEMFVALSKKYGVVPKEAMPETHQSSNTGEMNYLICRQLRQDAMMLRNAIADKKAPEEIHDMKLLMLREIYNLLCICLGNPPESFDFEYVDKDKNYHADRNLTPKQFYDKYLGDDLEQIISVINAPVEDKPFGKPFIMPSTSIMPEGKPLKMLNLAVEDIKAALIKQLQAGDIAWFCCDCGHFGDRKEGIWAADLYDYDTPFSLDYHMTKGEMMQYREISPAHAMVITGVNLVDGKPDKWKIENSWGPETPNKGYYIMSDEWFDRYFYTASINRKYLTEEQCKAFDQEAPVLDHWDPLA